MHRLGHPDANFWLRGPHFHHTLPSFQTEDGHFELLYVHFNIFKEVWAEFPFPLFFPSSRCVRKRFLHFHTVPAFEMDNTSNRDTRLKCALSILLYLLCCLLLLFIVVVLWILCIP